LREPSYKGGREGGGREGGREGKHTYLRQAMIGDEGTVVIEDEESLAGTLVEGLEVGHVEALQFVVFSRFLAGLEGGKEKGGRKGGRVSARKVYIIFPPPLPPSLPPSVPAARRRSSAVPTRRSCKC